MYSAYNVQGVDLVGPKIQTLERSRKVVAAYGVGNTCMVMIKGLLEIRPTA